MTRDRGLRSTGVLVLLLLLLTTAACSGSPPQRSTTGPEPDHTDPTSASTGRPPAPRDNWQWHVVATTPKQVEVPVLATRSWLVAPARADPSLPALYERDQDDRGPASVIRPSPGFELVDTLLAERWLVWHEQEAQPPDRPDQEPRQQVFIRHLDAGSGPGPPRRLDLLPRAPAPGLPPTYHLTGDHLVYPTQDTSPPGSHCLTDLALRTGHASTVACTERSDQGIGDGKWGQGGVTFNRWDPAPAPDGCLSVSRVGRAATAAETVPARRSCRPFSGVSGPGFTVWGERMPHAPEEARFYATTADGVVTLGQGDTGSEVICGRPAAAYWLSYEGEIPLVKRWRPGAPPEVVLRQDPRRWAGHYLLQCDSRAVRVLRVANGRDIHQLIEASIP